jgi:hypothetical protein
MALSIMAPAVGQPVALTVLTVIKWRRQGNPKLSESGALSKPRYVKVL